MPSLSRRPLAIGSEAEEGSSTLINEQEQRQQVCPPGQTPPLVGRSSSHYGGCMSRNDYHSELRNYFYSAGIPTIFDALSTALLQEKPEEPVDFILSWFRRERERVLTNAEEKICVIVTMDPGVAMTVVKMKAEHLRRCRCRKHNCHFNQK
ncbi:hypothetical protein TcG_03844 [Trypanosoma cruzi]|nr:hypothetical protein TcG_03844 [Trypanosoma cruzi]